MSIPESDVLMEMRVGMSLYWVTMNEDGDHKGWSATWKQLGRQMMVSCLGTKEEVLNEARKMARELEKENS